MNVNINKNVIWPAVIAGFLLPALASGAESDSAARDLQARAFDRAVTLAYAPDHKGARRFDASAVSIAGLATDPWYGYRPEQAIPVGDTPLMKRAYLEQLRGTEGEPLQYRRSGACAGHADKAQLFRALHIACYEVTHEGLEDSVTLFLDLSRSEPLYAPLGFTFIE